MHVSFRFVSIRFPKCVGARHHARQERPRLYPNRRTCQGRQAVLRVRLSMTSRSTGPRQDRQRRTTRFSQRSTTFINQGKSSNLHSIHQRLQLTPLGNPITDVICHPFHTDQNQLKKYPGAGETKLLELRVNRQQEIFSRKRAEK